MPEDTIRILRDKTQAMLKWLQAELSKAPFVGDELTILNSIVVDFYGTPTPLNQIATIGQAERHLIIVAPQDRSYSKIIEKAILNSQLGIIPQNDGILIRIHLPLLSEEGRAKVRKKINELSTSARDSVKRLKIKAVEEIESDKKYFGLSADEAERRKNTVLEICDNSIRTVESMLASKAEALLIDKP